jgi:hypothetical protein
MPWQRIRLSHLKAHDCEKKVQECASPPHPWEDEKHPPYLLLLLLLFKKNVGCWLVCAYQLSFYYYKSVYILGLWI